MLQFLESINPNACFTKANFEDALIDLEINLNSSDEAKQPQTKESLEKNFHVALICLKASNRSKPDRRLSFLLGKILTQYAILHYHHHYLAAKQLFLIALNFHLYTIGIFNECLDISTFSDLNDLKNQCESRPSFFHAMEESILTTSMERCMTLAYLDSFAQSSAKERLYTFAKTVQWLGYSYQNIDQYKKINDENDLRFHQLFQLAESLYLFIDDEKSKQVLADLYFEAWPFLHLRTSPEDIQGAIDYYEKALALDPSPQMKIRVGIARSALLLSNRQPHEALLLIENTLLQTRELSEQDYFLLSTLHDTFASILMNPTTLDLQSAEKHLLSSSNYATLCKNKDDDRLQFASYSMRLAEFKLIKGEFLAAKENIEYALMALQKQPNSQEPYSIQAEAMKSIIGKILAMRF